MQIVKNVLEITSQINQDKKHAKNVPPFMNLLKEQQNVNHQLNNWSVQKRIISGIMVLVQIMFAQNMLHGFNLFWYESVKCEN
jgi:hypothetical protein